ncbi:methyltransferase domain-containing protein (plasmid) [Cupriavidus basilensis]|uniref:Methyltransferase domain-containing protein n=2 Tax=Cupriavidus basilensis TaxID=68895 RepID=A0A643FZ19_9BURK|nr:methyltransferase domain-containing protein [Cupriavidus basilensis]
MTRRTVSAIEPAGSQAPGSSVAAAAIPAHFDALYARSDDPWSYRNSWYEARKRNLVLALLDRPRFRSAFEPGCGNGELSAVLALRCDSLLAADMHPRAVDVARQCLARMANVHVMPLSVPAGWPRGIFELIVISELAYYLSDAGVEHMAHRVRRTLAPGGLLLACHWRRPFGERMISSERAHELLGQHAGLDCIATHVEADFLMQAWTRGGRSVAAREGIA